MFAAAFLTAALAASPADTMSPPEARPALPAFEALSGFRPGERFDRDVLVGRVAVVNLWFEW